MSASPTILVTPVLPWPADQGSKQFQLDVARGLLEAGSVIWITRTVGDQADAESKLQAEGFELRLDRNFESQQPWDRLRRRLNIDWTAWRRRVPRDLVFTCTPRVGELVAAAHRAHPDAMAVGAFWHTAEALASVPRPQRVLVLSDIDHVRMAEAVRADHDSPHRKDVARLRRLELAAWNTVGRLVCLTLDDETAAQSAIGSSVETMRWPVHFEVPESCPAAREPDGQFRLLLYGHWQADFNRDGLDAFVEEIWPALRKAEPSLQVRIVGAGIDNPLAERLRSLGFTVVGWVESIENEIDQVDVIGLYLRFGGGLRYRLLESMARGRACISNRVAARGAGAMPQRDFVEAETAAEWADAVERLRAPSVRAKVAESGWSFVAGRYGTHDRASQLRALLTRAGQRP